MFNGFFQYMVIFHQEKPNVGYNPITMSNDLANTNEQRNKCFHLLDPDMVSILPVLEYVIQLPRFPFDLLSLSEDIIDKACNECHQVMIIPDSLKYIDSNQFKFLCDNADGIFVADDVNISEIDSNPVFGIHNHFELNQNLLMEQWEQAFSVVRTDKQNADCELAPYKPCYLLGARLNLMPSLFLARQYNETDEIFLNIFHTSDTDMEKTCANILISLVIKQNTYMKLHKMFLQQYPSYDMTSEIAKDFIYNNYTSVNENSKKECSLNVVVTLPGISKRQRKISGLSNNLPAEEKSAIRIMGLHCAIAYNAVLIELPTVSDVVYQYLDNIEQEIKKPQGTNSQFIWRMLRKIGSELGDQITDEQMAIILRASSITAFSDFPIGLAILPEQHVPLLISHAVYNKPLTPLSRNLVIEMKEYGQLPLYNKCRILFVECVPDDENHTVYNMSENLYDSIKNSSSDCSNVSVYREEAYTVKDLKRVLRKYTNNGLEVLIISAHGFYTEYNNFAGLCIGDEKWMANDNDFQVPPVVLLSACHVSPRGRNVVNAADILMRVGARVVISTLIPVSALKNTLIYSRLFVYIFEAIKGSEQYKTLADAWTGVVASNAVNEIMESSPALKKWYFNKRPNDIPRLFKFTLEKSIGRLRRDNIYHDTITVLKEMLKEDGLEGRFDSIFDTENYFPESFFYQMIGSPETILIYNNLSDN